MEEYIAKTFQTWCMSTTPQLRSVICEHIFTGSKTVSSFTQHYLKQVNLLCPWIVEEKYRDILVNGYIYYVAGLLFSMCHTFSTSYKVLEQRTLKYSLMCVISDFMLDTSNPEQRNIYINEMKKALQSLLTGTGTSSGTVSGYSSGTVSRDSKLHSATSLLRDIITDVPGCLPTVLATFSAELKSVSQQESKLSFEELKKIECNKGYLTYELLGCILNDGVSLNIPKELGYIIQIFDDIADMNIDQREHTTTIVTSCIQEFGNLDPLIYELCVNINKLPVEYWPFKLILSSLTATISCTNPYITPTLTTILLPYTLLNYSGKYIEDVPICRMFIYEHIEYNIYVRK